MLPSTTSDRTTPMTDGHPRSPTPAAAGVAARRPSDTRRPLVFGALVLVCVCLGLGWTRGVADGRLTDTDAYTWVHRAADLRADGDWFDETLEGVDPPAGHVQHWSRPFDVLLLVGGLVGEPFVGFRTALLAWALVVPCVLGAATLAVLWWGFADVLDEAGRDALALLAALQPSIVVAFMAGRSDHQALMALLILGIAGLSRRALSDPEGSRTALLAGGLSGVALWVGMEAALLVMGVVMAVAIQWIIRADHAVRTLMVYAVGLACGSAAALALEHGVDGMWGAQLDELSPTLVAGALLLAAVTRVLVALATGLTSPVQRTAALLILGVVAFALLVAMSPGILDGPLGRVDPLYERTRLRYIGELQPLFTASSSLTAGRLATGLSLVPFVVLLLVGRIRACHSLLDDGLHLLLVPAIVYLPFAVVQQRWLVPMNLLLVVPAALGVQRLMHAAAPRARRVHLGMAAVGAAAALWWVPVQAAAATRQPEVARCDIDAAVAALDRVGDGEVMAFVDHGPELLVRTGHPVMAIPNHRPQTGYTATYRAMSTTDPLVARTIIDEHGVDLVLVCTDAVEAAFYGDGRASFHHRLVSGDPPLWLRALPTPADEPRFRLYRVRP